MYTQLEQGLYYVSPGNRVNQGDNNNGSIPVRLCPEPSIGYDMLLLKLFAERPQKATGKYLLYN
jgi:hypothetical protein